MQVPIVRTVITPRQFARAFCRAWRVLGYSTYPTQAQVGVLYAQWMIETGGAACWCFNIGNVKVSQSQVDADVPWIDLPGTREWINGEYVPLKAGDPGRRFKAYSSLDEGMTEHLHFLRNTRYASCWSFVEAGDADGFARALKTLGYYTASASDYAHGMDAHFALWMRASSYADALKDALDADEAETLPDFQIIHPAVPLGPTDDEPPPDLA